MNNFSLSLLFLSMIAAVFSCQKGSNVPPSEVDKGCLLTRYESSGTVKSVGFSYDQQGRISTIEAISDLGDKTNWICKYNASGDITEMNESSSQDKYLITYQNSRVVKIEYFDKSDNSIHDWIRLGIYKFNDKNEVIEINFLSEILKFDYVNRNIVKATSYNKDIDLLEVINYAYDDKNSPLHASNPPPVLTFLLGRLFSGFTNNPVGNKMEGDINLKAVTYTYNSSNYPIEMKGRDENGKPVSAKYTYSNCP